MSGKELALAITDNSSIHLHLRYEKTNVFLNIQERVHICRNLQFRKITIQNILRTIKSYTKET